ncbi:SDR family NAD(P)-dependent oxidoreductase [Tundrisphaera sp. TA3]|uniref:SDR family NAD(P)-dependent oxidoreductase n=1 Tax=Tundrisphaera sp. TA3 TaxID=3435775 RepID=UPI003EBACBF4
MPEDPTPGRVREAQAPGGPVALVTGASAGLGRALAGLLVRERGMTVLATARRRDRLEALRDELPPGSVEILDGDLADPAFRERLWSWAESRSPRGVDLLVNNAGVGHYDDFADQDPAQIRQIVELNLMALMDLTQRAIRSMRPRGSGQILQISSTLGFVGLPYSAAYVASKHAVNGLVKSLRYELAGTGVRVWAACPGQTESEFRRVALAGHRPPPDAWGGEPTDKVARGILRGLDRRGAFHIPTMIPRAIVASASWLPGPFDWIMRNWAPRRFGREIGRRLD